METGAMRELLFVLIAFSSVAFGEGPHFRHKDTTTHQEFENVYKDIRRVFTRAKVSSTTLPSGSTQYIQNTGTFQSDAQFNVSTGTLKQLGVENNGPSTTIAIQVENTSNTSDSHATLRAIAGGSSAGDAFTRYDITSGTVWSSGIDNTDSDSYKFSQNATLGTNDYLIMETSGEVTKPSNPYFLVFLQGTDESNVTGDGTTHTINFNNEIFDIGSNFSNSSFTASMDGKYEFEVGVTLRQLAAAHTLCVFTIDTSNRSVPIMQANYGAMRDSNDTLTVTGTATLDLDANDVAYSRILCTGGSKVIDLRSDAGGTFLYTWFSGKLVQ